MKVNRWRNVGAERRAYSLLCRFLDDTQRRSYKRGLGFRERAPSGRTYLLGAGFGPRIKEIVPLGHDYSPDFCLQFERESPVGEPEMVIVDGHRRWLIQIPADPFKERFMPTADLTLTALLMIRYDEQSFRSIANFIEPKKVYGPKRPAYPVGCTPTEQAAWEACEGIIECPLHLCDESTQERFAGWHSELVDVPGIGLTGCTVESPEVLLECLT